MDLRHQARYRKWAYGFGPYVFNQEIYKDTAIYYSDPETGEPSGSRRVGAGRGGAGGDASTTSGQGGRGRPPPLPVEAGAPGTVFRRRHPEAGDNGPGGGADHHVA